MQFEGKVWKPKNGRHWVAYIEAFDLSTQGVSQKDALAMIKDAVESLIDQNGFKATVEPHDKGAFSITANNQKIWIGFLFERLRMKAGLTIEEVARRLGSASKTGYARYEQGKVMPSLDKFEQILQAISPNTRTVLKLAA